MIEVDGSLYGTTEFGGTYNKASYSGTVFSLNPATGKEAVLHSFGNGSDGAGPFAGLIDLDNTLYGTTYFGGAYHTTPHGDGTVFRISTTGDEEVAYSFGKDRSGRHPAASLVNIDGLLYGTTYGGFSHRDTNCPCGTAFSLTTTGGLRVLHTFEGGTSDGSNPLAGLINVNGTLYGTTECGGAYETPGECFAGTVFSLNPSTDAVKILHSFGNGKDGSHPAAGLLYLNGALYGTTWFGGAVGVGGNGTVFSISTTGTKYRLLHSFGKLPDGYEPVSGLIALKGLLYGTTYGGGAYVHYAGGTLFSITTNGVERVLHSFCGTGDICGPGGLLNERGTLYGTAAQEISGAYAGGVFAFTP